MFDPGLGPGLQDVFGLIYTAYALTWTRSTRRRLLTWFGLVVFRQELHDPDVASRTACSCRK
jgi:hypothetical protein